MGMSYFFFSFYLQTYIGDVVVSINPYRKFNLYTPERIAEYRSRNIYELPPHMWVQLNIWKQRIMNCFESLEAVDVVV